MHQNIYCSKFILKTQIRPSFQDIKTTCEAAIDSLQSMINKYTYQTCAAAADILTTDIELPTHQISIDFDDEYIDEAQHWLNELSKATASMAEVLKVLRDGHEV